MANNESITGLRRLAPSDLASPFTGRAIPGAAGAQGTQERLPQTVQIYLPEIFPIPSAQEFNPLAQKTTAAAETADIGLLVQVPPNNIAIIRGFTVSITNMLVTTNLTWTLNINGAPVAGYSPITIFPRAAPSVTNSFDSFIRVPQGAKITVTYTNNDGGTYVIGATVSGWWWPQIDGQRWMTQGPTI